MFDLTLIQIPYRVWPSMQGQMGQNLPLLPLQPPPIQTSNKAIESHKTPLSDKNPRIHRTLSESDIESY